MQSSTDLQEKILLSAIIGILGVCGGGVVIFFWRIWRPQRDYEIQPSPSEVMSLGSAEFVEPYEPQGWKGRASAKAREHWAGMLGLLGLRKDENVEMTKEIRQAIKASKAAHATNTPSASGSGDSEGIVS